MVELPGATPLLIPGKLNRLLYASIRYRNFAEEMEGSRPGALWNRRAPSEDVHNAPQNGQGYERDDRAGVSSRHRDTGPRRAGAAAAHRGWSHPGNGRTQALPPAGRL